MSELISRSKAARRLSVATYVSEEDIYLDLVPETGMLFETDGVLYTPVADGLVKVSS